MAKKINSFLAIISLIMILGGSWLLVLTAHVRPNSVEASNRDLVQTAVSLPQGETTYKITLEETGVYEITFAELQNAGLGTVDPSTLQMMHRGRSVAYQFIGDGDAVFESGEKIRFFGWAFDGSRAERQFVLDNVYWLWAGGTASHLTEASPVGASTTVTNYQATIRLEEDHAFDTMGAFTDWESTGFAPDSMYWQQNYRSSTAESTSNQITLEIPYPDEAAAQNVELTHVVAIREFYGASKINHTLSFAVNEDSNTTVTRTFTSFGDVFSVAQTFPITHLNQTTNTLDMTLARAVAVDAPSIALLNYITVTYQAQLSLYKQQLEFTADSTGTSTYQINRFTQDADNAIVWDITDPYTPISHSISLASGGSGAYTHTVNMLHTAGNRYIATETDGLHAVKSITAYTPSDIEPAAGTADWIAISHPDFIDAAQTLATHRAAYSHLAPHVVSLEDVANIYNHGFVSQEGVKAYLQHAYDNWSSPPQYALLIGDGNFDPRGVACQVCSFNDTSSFNWDEDQESFMPFNYAYVDRFQGLVPSDYDYALLAGNDLIPDIAVGRLSVETLTHANDVVNKIVLYENNLLTSGAWQDEILFIHDQPDDYDFKAEIAKTTPFIPDEFTITITGQETLDESVVPIQTAVQEKVNSGVALVNWRGHGATGAWGGDKVLSTDNPTFFSNLNQPMVILSMDCLDGNFTYPDRNGNNFDSLSETFLRQPSVATAAHWSSTGLGFPSEHEILAKYFYSGLFNEGLTTIGEAIDYSKRSYLENSGGDTSELYSFLLQGDPAMLLFLPQLDTPTVTTEKGILQNGEQGIIAFSWTNQSPYTASNQTEIHYTLPDMVTVTNSSNNISIRTTVNNSGETILIITFPNGVAGETTTDFTITLEATGGAVYLSPLNIDYQSFGISGSVDVTLKYPIYLPFLTTS